MSSKEVRLVFKKPKVFKSKLITAFYISASSGFKIGFNVHRRWGTAVRRNRFKRRVRGYFSNLEQNNIFLVIAPNVSLFAISNFYPDLKKLHSVIIKNK